MVFHGARRGRAEHLVHTDRLRKFLPDELVAPRQFAVLCKRPFDTLGVATIQGPGGMPWQHGLDLAALSFLFDHVQGRLARFFCLAQLRYWLS